MAFHETHPFALLFLNLHSLDAPCRRLAFLLKLFTPFMFFKYFMCKRAGFNPVLRYVILWYTSSYIPMFIIDQIEYAEVGKHCMFKLLRVGFYLKIINF